jgi:hypothetical protein
MNEDDAYCAPPALTRTLALQRAGVNAGAPASAMLTMRARAGATILPGGPYRYL